MNKALPPVIRVFISSTFADMENERNYFNHVITPKLTRLCATRGVSFFSVDLRWGITQEEQMNGEVLPICLREIDKCRPFFIGILGNRYGSVMEEVSESLGQSFPWLGKQVGKSVTELEMLYGVLEEERDSDCVFCFRSDELSKQFYNAEESVEKLQKLTELKETIKSRANIPSFGYDSLEEFGERIVEHFTNWLQKEFPTTESVKTLRSSWYNSELQRDYFSQTSMEEFLNQYCNQSKKALLVYGEGERGKTTLLANWQPEGRKIMINCGADSDYRYWPEIARKIASEISEIDESYDFPQFDAKATMYFRMSQWSYARRTEGESTDEDNVVYFVTDTERESFRKGFVTWLQQLQLKEEIYIVISDLNLIADKNSYFLAWLPAEMPQNLHLVCSANEKEIVENAQMLGWNCKEMPLLSEDVVKAFMDIFMQNYGKNLSYEQKERLYQTEVLKYPGYLKFVIKFLISYGTFENLDYLTKQIGSMQTVNEIYRFVLTYLLEGSSEEEKLAIYAVLAILKETRMPLKEEECYEAASKVVELNPLLWSQLRVILEQFEVINGDDWKVENREMKSVVEKLPQPQQNVNELLGLHFMKKLRTEKKVSPLRKIKENTEYAKAAVLHYVDAKEWRKLADCLSDELVLDVLTKLDWRVVRLAWMQMILYSEVNVGEQIKALLLEQQDQLVKARLLALLKDLEFFQECKEAEEMVQMRAFSELNGIDTSCISETFAKLYDQVVECKFQRDFRQVAQMTEKILVEHPELNAYERLNLYRMKVEAELQTKSLEKAMQTSGDYCMEAVRAMSVRDILSVMLTRGQCFYFAGQLEKARENLANAQRRAQEIGNLREYLAAKNLEAMTYYRTKEFDTSMQLFDKCIEIWKKVGNVQESATCALNRCNAIFLKGDTTLAIQETKKLYEFLSEADAEKYRNLRVMLLGNIGKYAVDAENLEEAEEALLMAIREAKGTHSEQALGNTYGNLIHLYEKNNLMLKAAEAYEDYLEHLFQARQFHGFLTILEREMNVLNNSGYRTLAEKTMQKWESRFEQVPNGKQIFQGIREKNADRWKLQRLKDALMVAKSENNKGQYAAILCEIAVASRESGEQNASDYYLEAADCFKQLGKTACYKECVGKALVCMMQDENVFQGERIDRVKTFLDEKEQEVVLFWTQTARKREEFLQKKELGIVFAEMMNGVAEVAAQGMQLAEFCVYDLTSMIVQLCSKSGIIQIMKSMKETQIYDAFYKRLVYDLVKDLPKNLNYLKFNYMGPEAEALLAYYEKTVDVLLEADDLDAAAVAGNIALIFRRRKEISKTLYYHHVSMEMYKKKEKIRDCLIEAMNLTTVYKEAKQLDHAVELLRESLKDAQASPYKDVTAAIAGNLAATLIEMDDPQYDEEIAASFAIEEEYFRSKGEARELVISLLNQTRFYLRNVERYKGIVRGKYMEAEKLVLEFQLQEFYEVIRKMYLMLPEEEKNDEPNDDKKGGLFGKLRGKFKK